MNKFSFVVLLFSLVLLDGSAFASLKNKLDNKNIRALHLMVNDLSLRDAEALLYDAKENHFNVVIFCLGDGVALKNFPGNLKSNAWTINEYLSLLSIAASLGIDIVPEVKLLTHQERFFGKKYPEFLFNESTYNPDNPHVYPLVFAYIDELVNLSRPGAVLIGHDEVEVWEEIDKNSGQAKVREYLPAELFAKDVAILNRYLSKKNVQTWMWGDMLISPEEFSYIKDSNMNGFLPGYGRELREKIPKSIVICDWQYSEWRSNFFGLKLFVAPYSSIAKFRDDGFTVLGATWKNRVAMKSFSSVAAYQGASGMISTTWFHVQKREWSVVDGIIHDSGMVFMKDFPDNF